VTDVLEEAPRDPRRIEAEIVRQRQELTERVAELSRRGHELTDVGLQVRRHALGVTTTVLAMGAVAAGSIALGIWRARRRNTLAARGSRLRQALARVIDRPERVAVEPTVTQRILAAAGSAAAAFLIKAALEALPVGRSRSVARPD
jgi:hypothetical protein